MKLFGRKFIASHWFIVLIGVSAILVTSAIFILDTAGFFPEEFIADYNLPFQVLWFLVIFWIIYNLRLILSFTGGKFSNGLFLISLGGLLVLLVALHGVFDEMGVSILAAAMSETVLAFAGNTIKLIGLVLVALGLHNLADLYRKHK